MRRAQFALAAVVVGAIATVTPAGGSRADADARRHALRRASGADGRNVPQSVRLSDRRLRSLSEPGSRGRLRDRSGPRAAAEPRRGFTVARKPFTVTYHIRPEARWSDGRPVTAADFQFTHKQYRTRAQPGFDQRVLYRSIRRTWVLGQKTFRVEFSRPFARWRELYPIVLPRHVLAGHDLTKVWLDRVDNPDTGAPIGSGPFLTGRLEKGKQLALVRNPRYWGPHTAYLDRIVYRFTGGADGLGPLRRNEVGFTVSAAASRLCPRTMAAQVRRLPGWRVVAWPAPLMEHFIFRVGSGGHPALKNRLVRRALAFGIDRAQIARACWPRHRRGTDVRSTARSSSPRSPTTGRTGAATATSPPARGACSSRPAAAAAPTASTCAPGSGCVCASSPPPGRRTARRFCSSSRRNCAGRGSRRALVRPSRVLFEQILPGGVYDAALFAWGTCGGGVTWPEAGCGDDQNWAGYCSRLDMRDYKQVDVIVDPVQRARVLNDLDAKLARAVPRCRCSIGPTRRAARGPSRVRPRRRDLPLPGDHGGLVARARALAAALAASLLAVAGAGGSGAQTPQRGGTVVVGSPAAEPPCLNLSSRVLRPAACDNRHRDEVLEGAFEIGPDLSYRPNLVSGVEFAGTRSRSRTTSGRRRAGTTACRSAPPTSRSPTRRIVSPAEKGYQRVLRTKVRRASAPSTGRRSRIELARRSPTGAGSSRRPAAPRARGARTSRRSGRDRIDNPKTGRPIGSGPFLVERWSAAGGSCFVRNPSYWGPHTAYLERLVLRFLHNPALSASRPCGTSSIHFAWGR